MSKLEIVLLIANCTLFGFFLGAMLMQARSANRYGKEHDRITAGIIYRLYKSMLSLCYDRDDIDRVVERMGQKIIPPSIPAPTHVLTPKKNREKTEK